MEGRPEYKIPGEEGLIAKWKKGELDISGNANWQKWIASLKKAAAKGIAVKRVRVAPKPSTAISASRLIYGKNIRPNAVNNFSLLTPPITRR